MAQTTGRNAPCPCGSGRKHKNCCLAGQVRALPLYNSRDREKAIERVLSFGEDPRLKEAKHEAWAQFWGARIHEAMEHLNQDPENADFSVNSFLYAWLFDFSLDKDHETVAARFLGQQDRSLPSSERIFLERMAESTLRAWEVTTIRPGQGLDLKDLEYRTVTAVKERLATLSVAPGDILGARVVPGPEGSSVIEGGIYPFHAMDTGKILVELEHRRRGYLKEKYDSHTFHKRLSTYVHHLWIDLELLRPPPTLVTTDQEPLVLARTFFDLRDPGRVTAELSGTPGLTPQGDGSYVWLEDAGASSKVLGTVSVNRNRLFLDTFSEARAASGRTFLEELLGDAIEFRATRLEDPMQSAIAGDRKPQARDVVPPGLESEIVSQLYRNHYEAWLDQPVPALGDRTPRKAAKLKTVRPKLIALLKQLDNQMDRDRLNGRPAIDTDWLWEELGLQRE